MLVAGEPGIGKTRLLEEFASVVQQQVALFWGRCWEGDGTPAFWPWVQIVRAYVSGSDPLTLLEELGSGAADIAQIVPEVRNRLPQLPMPLAIDPEYARFRFFDGIASFLRNAARRHPLVLLFDDLHWADTSSLRLVHFLARELRQARILMVGAYRDVEVTQSEALSAALGDLIRESQRLELGGLSRAELALFMTQASNTTPTDTLVNTLHEQTNGNPFFINEMVRLFMTEGRLQSAGRDFTIRGGLPLGVRETIRRRLARLSTSCRQMLAVAAVVGRDFRLEILRQVESGPDVSQDKELLPLLDEALGAQLIDQKSETISHYRFIHALVRETLYEDLPLPVRVALRERVGAAIERLYKANLEPHLAELADHFFKALPGSKKDKAIHYARRAGERAIALFAYEEAVVHLARSLQLVEPEFANSLVHAEVLLALADARHRVGDAQEATNTYLQTVELARKLGALTGMTEAARVLARAALGVAGQGELRLFGDQTPVTLLEEALQVLVEDESALRGRLLSRLAIALYFTHSRNRVELLSQQAVSSARQGNDPITLAEALKARYYALWDPDHLDERLVIAAEMLQLAEAAGVKEWAFQGHWWRLLALFERDDMAAVDRELHACARLAGELRQPYYHWVLSGLQAIRTVCEGRFAEAERLAQEGLTVGQQTQGPNANIFFMGQLFYIRKEQGRLHEFEDGFRGYVEAFPNVPAFRCGLALLYSELDKKAEAREQFEALAAHDFRDIPRDGIWLNAMDDMA